MAERNADGALKAKNRGGAAPTIINVEQKTKQFKDDLYADSEFLFHNLLNYEA